MKQTIRLSLFLALTFIVAVLSACEDRAPIAPQQSSPSTSQEEGVSRSQIDLKEKGAWPPVSNGNIALASNLLAKNYYVVQDGSGSMSKSECSGDDSKSVASKKALADFAKIVPQDANLGLLAFDSKGITERVPLGIKNRAPFIKAVYEVDADRHNTPLHNAIVRGLRALEKQAQRQLGYGEYHLVIITDGYDNGGQNPQEAVNWITEKTPVIIHTIGFCLGSSNEKHSLDQPGKTFYATAQNPKELFSGLKAVLAESEQFDVKTFQK